MLAKPFRGALIGEKPVYNRLSIFLEIVVVVEVVVEVVIAAAGEPARARWPKPASHISRMMKT